MAFLTGEGIYMTNLYYEKRLCRTYFSEFKLVPQQHAVTI